MLVKTPDYIIAECGCPQLGRKSGTLEDFATLKRTACIIRDTNKRLLPLRETLMDSYARQLVIKLKAWEITKSNAKLKETLRNNRCKEPATIKQLKTQCNETIKHHQQQQLQANKNFTNSKQNILDNSRHSSRVATTRTTTRTTTTTTRPTLDNDLDVF